MDALPFELQNLCSRIFLPTTATSIKEKIDYLVFNFMKANKGTNRIPRKNSNTLLWSNYWVRDIFASMTNCNTQANIGSHYIKICNVLNLRNDLCHVLNSEGEGGGGELYIRYSSQIATWHWRIAKIEKN